MIDRLEEIKTMDKKELHKFVLDLYNNINDMKSYDFDTLLTEVHKREGELQDIL